MARWHKDMGEETQEKQKMFSFYKFIFPKKNIWRWL